jgi:DNA polymerase III epsilon subunit-like protein
MHDIIVIDYETSAFPEKGGAPIGFGAAILDPFTLDVKKTFERFMLLEEGDFWDFKAQHVHGIQREWLDNNGVPRQQAYQEFIGFLRENGLKPSPEVESNQRPMLCGHNVELFDAPILKSLKGIGPDLFSAWFHYRMIDTMKLAFFLDMAHVMADVGHIFQRHGIPSVKLDALRAFYGIKGDKAHDALGDVLDTAVALKKMLWTMKGGISMLGRLKEFRGVEDLSDGELGARARDIFGAR